jgi:hypothetical protein
MILMSKYHSAMEKITVSDLTEKRILEDLSNRNIVGIENARRPYRRWCKPMGAFAVCFSVLLVGVLIYSSFASNNNSAQLIRTPKLVGTINAGNTDGMEQSNQVDAVGSTAAGTSSGSAVAGAGAGAGAGANAQTGKGLTKAAAGGTAYENEKSGKGASKATAGNAASANAQIGNGTTKTTTGSTKHTNTKVGKGSPKTTVADNNSHVGIPDQESQQNKQTVPVKNNDIVVSTQQPQPQSDKVAVCNPIVQVKDISELKKAVTYQLLVPSEVPAGYEIESISVITGSMAQIIYNNKDSEDDKIVYRTSSGTEDISGDYNTYETVDAIKVKAAEVTLKGSKTLVNLAIWSQDGCTFSLSFSIGANKEAVMSIVNSLNQLQ